MIRQLLECDGCGKRDEESTGVIKVPEGWEVRQVQAVADIGRPARGGADFLVVCPECWGSKTLAEVLGR